MANTGFERSLTLIVKKTVNGEPATGYPKTYNGRNEFANNGTTYPAITLGQLANLQQSAFNIRLGSFKNYVEGLEFGLDIDAVTVAGKEAYRENLVACPIV